MASTPARWGATFFLLFTCATSGQGAYFSGNAFFSQTPISQLGPVVSNTLGINNGPFSITVAGQVKVLVPPGNNIGGTLLEWTVDRPLDPNYGTSNMITATTLNGFSQPPANGTYGNTSGNTFSFLDQYPVVSKSNIPLTLTAGVANWIQITVQSSTFSYTSATGNHYLRQRFELDGVQVAGAGGQWLIDLPLTTDIIPVPEPQFFVLTMAATVAVATTRRLRNH